MTDHGATKDGITALINCPHLDECPEADEHRRAVNDLDNVARTRMFTIVAQEKALDKALSSPVPTWMTLDQKKFFCLEVIFLDDFVKCPKCKGDQEVREPEHGNWVKCPKCKGAGQVLTDEAIARIEAWRRKRPNESQVLDR